MEELSDDFIEYLLTKRLDNFIFFMGFIFALIGYSFWHPLGIILNLTEDQSYQLFYVCIAAAFFFYTLAYYLTKYHKWRWFPMFVYLVCGSRLILELTNPKDSQVYDLTEYALFMLTIFIVFYYYIKHKYDKFKKNR